LGAQIGDDPDLAAGGEKLDGNRDGLGFARGHAHIFIYRLPAALSVLHLEIRDDEPIRQLLRRSAESAAIRPIHPSIQQQDGFA
jgi:hypothetical protein